MRNCSAYSSDAVSTPRSARRRKKALTGRTKNQNKAKPILKIDWQLLDWQLNNEVRVNLDETIVGKYLGAKKVIDEILRPNESKRNFKENRARECKRMKVVDQNLDVDNHDDQSFADRVDPLRESSIETRRTSNTSCENPTVSSVSIKNETLDKKSCITLYDYGNLNADMQIVEIPFDSNIVLNPVNNRVAFSKIDHSFIENNEADVVNANICNDSQDQETVKPKYLYNPMNNIITSSQTNDDSDGNNNNEANVMPADMQFAPGEYMVEDSFLNDNYNVVNTFSLEPSDMGSNQNAPSSTEQSSVEEIPTTQLVDAVLDADTTSDLVDSTNDEKADDSEILIESFVNEQGSLSHDETSQKDESESDENTCMKCHKKFILPGNLRKHELTCGMTFYYNCLFCPNSSMFSQPIKCHMANQHAKQVEIYGMKQVMELVSKKRRENKETNLNILLKKKNQDMPDAKSDVAPVNNFEKSSRRKQSFSKARSEHILEIKKEIAEEQHQEEHHFSNVQIYVDERDVPSSTKNNFKPSKEYVDAFCSNCRVYFKNLKSGAMKCCPNCQSPLIYKCAVCKKCFSKYLSILGHVKCHTKPISREVLEATEDKHCCGYCNYETIEKSDLLRHILWHVQGKSVKVKREIKGEYSG